VDDCRLGVREMVAAGADAIKIATTGGVGSDRRGPLDRQFTDEEVFALVDEAHAWGKKVLSHAHGGEGARQAVQAGADSIDHGTFLHRNPELLEEMADRGQFLVPTLSIVADHVRLGPPAFRVRAGNLMDECRRTIERAQELGVKMAMGTDAGAYGHARNAREVRFLVEVGISPMTALVMSTSAAAECIGLQDTIGSLEAGKLADLLVVDGDPLRQIGVLEQSERLRIVMQGGTAYVHRLDPATPPMRPSAQREAQSR
jgi:imidazolonepropionase-like amidohydrolase